jgi:hypothetical protein
MYTEIDYRTAVCTVPHLRIGIGIREAPVLAKNKNGIPSLLQQEAVLLNAIPCYVAKHNAELESRVLENLGEK